MKTVHLGVNRNITIKLVTKLTNWSINYEFEVKISYTFKKIELNNLLYILILVNLKNC